MKPRNSLRLTSFSDVFQKRLGEAVLILIAAMTLFLLLSLFTHVDSDPSWRHLDSSASSTVINGGGRVGAFISDLLLYTLGGIAYWLPVLLFYSAWLYFRLRDDARSEYFSYLLMLRGAGLLFLLLTSAALSSLLISFEPYSGGGLLGQEIGWSMVQLFNGAGSCLILISLFLTGITLFTGLSWLKLADRLGEAIWKMGGYCQRIASRVDQWAENSSVKEPLLDPPSENEAQKPKIMRAEPQLNVAPSVDFSVPPEITHPEWAADQENSSQPLEPILSISSIQQSDAVTSSAFAQALEEQLASQDEPKLAQTVSDLDHSLEADTFSTQQSSVPIHQLPRTVESPVQVVAPRAVLPKKPIIRQIYDRSLEGTLPPLTLLDPAVANQVQGYSNAQLETISSEVELRLQDFGIQVKVVSVHPGPVVTRFELQLAAGTKVSRITALAKDLARSLSVISVRVVEIIPGKPVIGLELPNIQREIVRLREILGSDLYQSTHSPLTVALGKDIAGHPVVVDLAKMPHLLVAGTTGSGKSVGLNAMLLSLLYKSNAEQLRMILIDPKMLELSIYEGIPHLLTPVVTDMKDAANALRWAVAEMDRRYRLMAALGVRNLAGFNAKVTEAESKGSPIIDPFAEFHADEEPPALSALPYIVILVDEFADMMMLVGKKVEELIARIAQKARAAGIHLILATQRPSVDVITGLIKANIPTRIAFQVSSKIDSRTILDQQGAEQLLGHGDMLYLPPGTGVPIRIHGAYVADEEVHRVVQDLQRRGQPQYLEEILTGEGAAEGGSEGGGGDQDLSGEQDPLYDQAVQIVVESRRASISHIQRRLKIGYNRAANIIEAMEAAGVVSRDGGSGREVLVQQVEA